jgi:hypothetical protein
LDSEIVRPFISCFLTQQSAKTKLTQGVSHEELFHIIVDSLFKIVGGCKILKERVLKRLRNCVPTETVMEFEQLMEAEEQVEVFSLPFALTIGTPGPN